MEKEEANQTFNFLIVSVEFNLFIFGGVNLTL